MSPALNRSFALQRFEHGSEVELHTRNNVRFLPGTATHIMLVDIMNVFKTEGGAKQIYENEITKYLS